MSERREPGVPASSERGPARSAESGKPRLTRYGASRADVARLVQEFGEPTYRLTQIWDALHRERVALDDATALPMRLRTVIGDRLPLAWIPEAECTAADGRTTKWLFASARDGAQVETVLLRSEKRATVCVSSQAGCAMACTFCATGQDGFERHLDTGEIVEQVARAAQAVGPRVTNVVYMGMGEPLANYEPVWESVERLHGDLGLSARHLTVSTVGVVPGMRRLAAEDLAVTLAVSLHAPDDETRNRLVPLGRRYPLAEVLDAAAEHAGAHGRRVTFEYACIRGVNDRPDQAAALARLLRSWPGRGGAHVNLIPLNPTPGFGGVPPDRSRVQAFSATLRSAGVNATVRRSRGVAIDAACGQLRHHSPVQEPILAPRAGAGF